MFSTFRNAALAAAAILLLFDASAAQATPIRYQFSTVPQPWISSGFFTYDAATNQESAVSITVSGIVGTIPDLSDLNGVYTQVAPITPPSTTPFGTAAANIIVATSGANEAWIGFLTPLGPLGGDIRVVGVGRTLRGLENEIFSGPAFGVATPAAEPTSLAILGVGVLGLAGLGLQRRGNCPLLPSPRRSEPR